MYINVLSLLSFFGKEVWSFCKIFLLIKLNCLSLVYITDLLNKHFWGEGQNSILTKQKDPRFEISEVQMNNLYL